MLEKIISGGQTGPDRAALEVAICHGMAHGGWCPKGRLAEDGVIDPRYDLMETLSADPAQRTEFNVRDSDGTVIFSIGESLSGGSRKTAQICRRLRKPCLHLARDRDRDAAASKLSVFIKGYRIKTLNVAGPRSSQEPEAGDFARKVLEKLVEGDQRKRAQNRRVQKAPGVNAGSD